MINRIVALRLRNRTLTIVDVPRNTLDIAQAVLVPLAQQLLVCLWVLGKKCRDGKINLNLVALNMRLCCNISFWHAPSKITHGRKPRFFTYTSITSRILSSVKLNRMIVVPWR